MVSPYGTIPDSLITEDARQETIAWLNLNIDLPELRRYLLIGWADETNVTLTAEDYTAIGFPQVKITGE